MAYNSKYTGQQVEALLEKVDGEGAIPTKTSELENDSGFITSAALDGYATTETMNNKLNGKEDKLAFYSENGGDATLAADGQLSLSSKDGDVTLAADKEMSVSCGYAMSVTGGLAITITATDDVAIIAGGEVDIESEDVSISDNLNVCGATTLVDVEASGKTTLSGDVTIGGGRKNVSVDISGELQTHGEVYFSPGGISEGRVYYNGTEIATVDDVAIRARYEEFLPSLLQTLPRNMDYGVMANVFYVMYPYQIEFAGSSPQLTINGSDYDVAMEEYATGIYKLTPSGFRMTAAGELAITFPAGLFTLHNKSNSETVSSPEIYVYCPESDPLAGR